VEAKALLLPKTLAFVDDYFFCHVIFLVYCV
jgi:hypothetical protein